MCPAMWAHWHHLANTIELVLSSAHPSPQPKRQIDRFSRFCTAHGRKSLILYNGRPFPQKLPLLKGWSRPPSNSDSLGQSKPTIQRESWSVQLFSHRWPESVSMLYNGRPFPPKLPLAMGDLDPHLIHGSLGPPKFSIQTASRSVQPFL